MSLQRKCIPPRLHLLQSLIGATAIALSTVSCNAREQLPQSPSPMTAPPSASSGPSVPTGAAYVFVQAVTAFRESQSSGEDTYHVAFQLRETGGSTGATVKAIELAFENGLTATFGPEVAETAHIGPGATVKVSGLSVTGTRASRAVSLQIRVLVTDDNGANSTSSAAASVIATYRLLGRIIDEATSRPVANAVVTVTFGAASGRSATSDGAGNYVLFQIPVGSVAFNVSAAGYSTVTKTANVSADTTVDVALPRPR